MAITEHVIVRGRVQGVGYRAWVSGQARMRGLVGWVRNRSDGTVEALFAGEQGAVEAMLEACLEGPPAARVERMERRPSDEAPPEGFMTKPTV